jgi:hypothetical protein
MDTENSSFTIDGGIPWLAWPCDDLSLWDPPGVDAGRGVRFGARMFVIVQTIDEGQVQGVEPVVQMLLANTSIQAFFSPDPEGVDLIRTTLISTVHYDTTTLNLPSLHCWLRACLSGLWQPPTLARVKPLTRSGSPQQADRPAHPVGTYCEAHPNTVIAAVRLYPGAARAVAGRSIRQPSVFATNVE